MEGVHYAGTWGESKLIGVAPNLLTDLIRAFVSVEDFIDLMLQRSLCAEVLVAQ